MCYNVDMFEADTRRLRDLERGLKRLSDKALPFATRNFVNDAAFAISKKAKSVVKDKMVTRNTWTVRSIGAMPTRERSIGRMEARAGSREEYMLDQEFGTVKRKGGSEGVRIATSWSAGQEGSRPRTRLPRKVNRIANILLRKRRGFGRSQKQKNLAVVHAAVQSKKRFVYMDLGRKKGIFKVIGGRKRVKRNEDHRVKGARIKMVHDLTEPFVVIPANPWLRPSLDAVTPKFPRMYASRLNEQIRRVREFRLRR